MTVFLKFMVVSACLLLSPLILFVSSKTYKDKLIDNIVFTVFDVYAVALIFTAFKIFFWR